MCKVLNISRSGYYAYLEQHAKLDEMNDIVVDVFNENQKVYGTRKIKAVLATKNIRLSRRRIARIMHDNGLVSAYTVKKFKPHKTKVNEEHVENKLHREFSDKQPFEVVVSDLTYVRVGNDWNYICILLDLHAREVIGYSCGKHKDAQLVYQAFASVRRNLNDLKIFHTDRGSEFKNYRIDDLLTEFGIERSLSKKGCPYDNAVAEATFKIIKTEFVRNRPFEDLKYLHRELSAYIYWFNNKRVHSTLGYMSPITYKKQHSLG